MDGGIIEGAILDSMMTGAAVGGGSSLLQGKDPLQGALLGGLMGGAGGAMFGGAGAAPSGAMPGAAPAATTVASATPAATAGIESAFAPTATQFGAFGEAPLGQSFDSFGNPVAAGSPAATMADPTGLAQQQMALNAAKPAASQGILSGAKDLWSGLSDKQKLLAGGAGIAGFGMIRDQMRGGVPKKQPYSGALSRFSYNPDTYVPWSRGFSDGGGIGLNNQNMNPAMHQNVSSLSVGSPNMNPATMSNITQRSDMFADGGIASLGGYSDGGRMLKGPGDGMSDSIPAQIGSKQPARLADGEFVVPADVVSHLGNGSTDAGAKQLYSMMNKVRKARTGNPKQGKQIHPGKYLPA
jgi:hypothetical protein